MTPAPRVQLRAVEWSRDKAYPPSTRESFVFHKHKAWKWLRMEPPNHHCLGWEWEEYWVGGGGYSQWQPACQASAWHWEQLCV